MDAPTFITVALVVMATILIRGNEACECNLEDGTTCPIGATVSNTNCGTAVCTNVGGDCKFLPGSDMNSNDCVTPEGVCQRNFKRAHLNVNTCKKYMCIRGSLRVQTLCFKDGQCQSGVQPATINDEECSCRVNLDNDREEWGCGEF